MRRRLPFALVALLAFPLVFASSAAAQEQPVVLVGGRVLTAAGDPIEEGRVVIVDGRIRAVGADAAVPGNARVVDCEGRSVTPGFIGVESAIGLVEIDLEESTSDAAPEGDHVDSIRAAFSAADAYHPLSTLIGVARRGGVTSVVSTPQQGLVSGVSGFFDLLGTRPADVTVNASAALHVNLGASHLGARPSAYTRIREAFADARLFRQRGAAIYDRRGLRELSLSTLDLQRLAEALAGDLPVVIRANRSSDILRALALAEELDLDVIVSGAAEGWMVADEIAEAGVPVIVKPLTNLPESFGRIHARYDNATRLAAAGVRLIFSTTGAHDLRNLRQEAGNAIARGVDRHVALRALTAEPAAAFGVGDDYGTLERGRVANVVVWTGDPFETTTWAERVFIRGRDVPLRSRQTELRDRYRDLESVNRGQAGLPRVGEATEPE